MMSSYQILNKLTIINMLCSKWISHRFSHLKLHLRRDIVMKKPFSQNISTKVYINKYYVYFCMFDLFSFFVLVIHQLCGTLGDNVLFIYETPLVRMKQHRSFSLMLEELTSIPLFHDSHGIRCSEISKTIIGKCVLKLQQLLPTGNLVICIFRDKWRVQTFC